MKCSADSSGSCPADPLAPKLCRTTPMSTPSLIDHRSHRNGVEFPYTSVNPFDTHTLLS